MRSITSEMKTMKEIDDSLQVRRLTRTEEAPDEDTIVVSKHRVL